MRLVLYKRDVLSAVGATGKCYREGISNPGIGAKKRSTGTFFLELVTVLSIQDEWCFLFFFLTILSGLMLH